MKIILIATVAKLGKIGDVVEVKSGYAKNFLIPSKKAISFTQNNYKIFESKKHEFEKENLKNLDSASKVIQSVLGKDIILIKNASDDGRLYGSVTSADIAAKVNEVIGSSSVSRSEISLNKPIKEIGLYHVKFSPHSEASCELRLIVSRSESEVKAILDSDKKANNKSQKSEQDSQESEVVEIAEKPKKQRVKKSEKSE